MSRLIIGIDPGEGGAAVPLVDGAPVVHAGHPVAARWKGRGVAGRQSAIASLIPTLQRLGHRVERPRLVVIERVAINYHGKNQRGMAGLIEEAGGWEWLCTAWGWPVERRLAGSWLGDVALPGASDTKARALAAAQAHWPGVDWRASSRATKAHDGLVDAALLALCADLELMHPGAWTVERDGTGRGWSEKYNGASRFRAGWTFDAEVARATRGAVRLVRDGKEVRRWEA